MTKYGEMNIEKMNEQELKDYKVTEKIMHQIFKTYGAKAHLTKEPIYSPVDASMWVEKNNDIKKYKIEIKERLSNYLDINEVPLKVQKYCNIIDATSKGEIPLIVYLLNNSEYYIFDLNKIDFNKVKIPTFFIPLSQCIYNGLIPLDNADN